MRAYTVKMELVVYDYDETDPGFEKAAESIKDDIGMELNGCWHSMDIVSMDVYE